MEKLHYVLWRRPSDDPGTIERALLDEVAPALVAGGAGRVRLFVEDPVVARSFRYGAHANGQLLTATISFWLDSLDRRSPFEASIARARAAEMAGYLVTESVPRGYQRRDWPDGARSPGVSIVTIFDKSPAISDEDFYAEWHGRHTPMSFEIHPLSLYVRNSVARPLTADAPTLRGIVEEAVPTVDDLLDPDRFFGGNGDRARMKANIGRINAHLAGFADAPRLETCAMADYIVSS